MKAKEFIKSKTKTESEMPYQDAVKAGAMSTGSMAKNIAQDIQDYSNSLTKNLDAMDQEIKTQRAASASIPSNVNVTSTKPDGSWTGRTQPPTTKIGPISISRGAGNPAAGGAVPPASNMKNAAAVMKTGQLK
jgi:hypothetical protein